jgi:hypothetical protein
MAKSDPYTAEYESLIGKFETVVSLANPQYFSVNKINFKEVKF